MTLFGDGRAVIEGDRETAERVGWGERRRSLPEPEIVLSPRQGDPRSEPWITPPGWIGGVDALSSSPADDGRWHYLADVPGVVRYIESLAAPVPTEGWRVAIAGLGRVGGTAAAALAAVPAAVSGIRELLLYDVDASNQERWLMELEAIERWRGEGEPTRVLPTAMAEVFSRCDVFLFVAAAGVPPLGTQGDVRLVQLEPNRLILKAFLEHARAAGFTGLFLVVSDPVDWLAQAAFHDSNAGPGDRFAGSGLAPERIAGLGLGVMWARALAAARREGWGATVARRGGVFGPHDVEVLAYDDLEHPSPARSGVLTRAARESNFLIRNLGFLPFVGPGVSSVGLTLPRLLSGAEILASTFVDGVYLGCPAHLRWGVHPSPQRLGPEVDEAVRVLHAGLHGTAERLGLTFV